MVRAVLVIVALASCTPAQAPTARKIGKAMALGGVTGLIVGSASTHFVDADQLRPILVGFSFITTIGIGAFAAGELSVPRESDETIPQRNQRWARILTERAHDYARDGHSCYRVRHIETRVRVYDRVLHEGVFMRDPAIQKCLANVAPEAPPEAPELPQPVEPLALPGTP